MTRKDTFTIGFMLFALFFGAGNLIYPPELGIQAGTSYWEAIAGFILTGVGLPIVGVAAIALVSEDLKALGSRVHPWFGLAFTVTIYLAIGPFFGIPRAANVAYEMGVIPIVGSGGTMLLFGFTVVFFAIVLLVSLNPSKIVDRIGQWLTPILLLAILCLSVLSFFKLDAPIQAPEEAYMSAPFFKGFVNGYLTMDAIAGLAFGIIVVTALKDRGVTGKKTIFKQTLKVGAVTAIGLAFVYASIGWMGAKLATFGSFDGGAAILSAGAEYLFGSFGAILIGLIVSLACFTTCVGLTVACSQFFSSTFSGLKYSHVAVGITIVSFLVSNLGLAQIISFSVPVLYFIYPLAIVLMGLTFFHRFFKGSSYVYRGALLFTSFFSLYSGLNAAKISWGPLQEALSIFPFFEEGLGWLVPALVGAVLGYILDRSLNHSKYVAATKRVS